MTRRWPLTRILGLTLGSLAPSFATAMPAAARFIDLGDETVRDVDHGLHWARRGSGVEGTFEDATAYCESLQLAGHHDWRLPTIEELATLHAFELERRRCGDFYCRVPSVIEPTSVIAWSATRNGDSEAYCLNLYSSQRDSFPIGNYHALHAICVRSSSGPGSGEISLVDRVALDGKVASKEERPGVDGPFLRLLAERVETAEAEGAAVVHGRDGFLFLTSELRALTLGRFWGDDASRVSRVAREEARDPLPAIRGFAREVRNAGGELLFVRFPAKAAIYPDVLESLSTTSSLLRRRCCEVQAKPACGQPGRAQQEFLQVLQREGIRALDLAPIFRAEREASATPLYCRQDSHWSPRGLAVAAAAIAAEIGAPNWLVERDRTDYQTESETITIRGDLATHLKEPLRSQPETVRIERVGVRVGGRLESIATSRDSPVLVLGDSHGLVFHAGEDMHARGAGLVDHLARELGIPIDLIAVRGSGATPSRLALRRRGADALAGKKFVIWCLSVREYTEGQGWRQLPPPE